MSSSSSTALSARAARAAKRDSRSLLLCQTPNSSVVAEKELQRSKGIKEGIPSKFGAKVMVEAEKKVKIEEDAEVGGGNGVKQEPNEGNVVMGTEKELGELEFAQRRMEVVAFDWVERERERGFVWKSYERGFKIEEA